MSHTVTITLEDEAYQRLQEQFEDKSVDRVIEDSLRPFTDPYPLAGTELAAGYASTAADKERETEALAWAAYLPDEALENADEDWSWLQPAVE